MMMFALIVSLITVFAAIWLVLTHLAGRFMAKVNRDVEDFDPEDWPS